MSNPLCNQRSSKSASSRRPGVDLEYAQRAIERCEAQHRPLSPLLWVVVDAEGATAKEWEHLADINEVGCAHVSI